jgi:RHS repeat-associated protein
MQQCFRATASAIALLSALPVNAQETPPFQISDGLTTVSRFSSAPSDAEIFAAGAFEEPLVPLGRTSLSENRELTRQLERYLKNGAGESLEPFDAFLAAHPSSPWKASLLVNTGLVHRRTGRFWRALDNWKTAWLLSRESTDPMVRSVADRALGEYADTLARLGRAKALEALLAEVRSRKIGGSAAEKIVKARESLASMRMRPESAFRCGPLALDRVLASSRRNYVAPKVVREFPSTVEGTSLTQIARLANDVGERLQMAKRLPGSALVVPAVVHWKSGHFAAVVREAQGRYLVEDAVFAEDIWMSRAALEDEASGYVLVGNGPLPYGWRAVTETEGDRIWGRGGTIENNPQNFKPCDPKAGCSGGSCPRPGRMAVHDIHLMLVSLNITDEPVGYSPPIGPAVGFRVTYNQREVYQPQIFSYMNLGPKWTFDWVSYIEDNPDPNSPLQSVKLYVRGGGQETYTGFGGGTQSTPHKESRAVVKRTSTEPDPIRYERHLPDGSVEVFEKPVGAAPSRKVFLTRSIDPQGNSVTLTYAPSPSGLQLTEIVDAIGQKTTLYYELPPGPGNDLLITKVTDPFQRSATFDYVAGRLDKITDVIGIQSSFEYGADDFITKLTTPYGPTLFATGLMGYPNQSTDGVQRDRWIQVTDPLGGKERVEYYPNCDAPHYLSHGEPVHPPGFEPPWAPLCYRNTFYWDKLAMAAMEHLPPGTVDYSKARIFHWLHDPAGRNSGILESKKAPLENRIWYAYAGQSDLSHEGTHAQPSEIARVLYDPPPGPPYISQSYKYSHNMKGKVCESVDPMVRRTRYTYGSGGIPDSVCTTGSSIDLLKVEQKNGASWELVQVSTYNGHHQPLTVTDAAGQTTTYSYLADGRLETIVTPPRNGHDGNPLSLAERTTTYEYYPGSDPIMPFRLKRIVGPSVGTTTGPITSFTYDLEGRVRTSTDPDLYTLTMDYDALDRPTKTTYPDGTYEETRYKRLNVESLDAEEHRDRLGRWSYTRHDALRRLWQTEDPLGRRTTMHWCACGSLDGITDADGNTTTWERDLQGRVGKEIRADGKFWEYTYEAKTSRVKSVTDPKLQVKTYTYDLDDKVSGIAYADEEVPTPDVTYSYLDAGSDPDPYGRLRRMVDGTGTTLYGYHSAGTPGALNLAFVDGPLAGSADLFEYSYDELGRVKNRKLNGVSHEVSYRFDSLGRLRTQVTPPGSFTYEYDGVTGRPASLVYPNAQRVDYAYHPNLEDHRLAQIHNISAGGGTLSKFGYTYFDNGNIETWSQQRGASSPETYTFVYDLADQVQTATLRNTAGTILATYAEGYDDVGNRTSHTLDGVGTIATYSDRNWITSQTLPPTTFRHDDNGNMTSDATYNYEWDAENRLVAVKEGGNTVASSVYDGNGRRYQRTAAGTTRTYIYDGAQIVEERLGTGAVIKYFDGPGIDQHLGTQHSSGTVSYFASDHLGSVTDVTTGAGFPLSRKYDPWGNLLSGSSTSGYAFTGRERDAETGLYYYRARYYDPKIGRFISEDPIGFVAGVNFYTYVENNPTTLTDPLGLDSGSGMQPNMFGPPSKPDWKCFRLCMASWPNAAVPFLVCDKLASARGAGFAGAAAAAAAGTVCAAFVCNEQCKVPVDPPPACSGN